MSYNSTVSDRLKAYNNNAYNAGTNPRGFSEGGHRVNFTQATEDVADAANHAGTKADEAALSAAAAAADAATAEASVDLTVLGHENEYHKPDKQDQTLAYDVDGNLESVTYADGSKELLSYNVDGNLETVEYTGTDGVTVLKTQTLSYTGDDLTGVAWS